ncbi:class I tRNA ligase family protein, partial [Elusimicrobiota bacterium]
SVGNVVDPLDMINEFGVDAFRFYLFRHFAFGKDASFSYEQFQKTYETELANELGNLLSRVLSMIEKYKPEYSEEAANIANEVLNDVIQSNEKDYEDLNFYGILERIWNFVRSSNKRIEDKKPWELAKKDTEKLGVLLTGLFQTLRYISGLIYPFMPVTSRKMREQMGITHLSESDLLEKDIELNFDEIKKGDPLFPKK